MHKDILRRLLESVPPDSGMELPPKVSIDMQCEFIEFLEGEKLIARFPNLDRYMNPFGFMQGGIIVAAMDNTMSPLSYSVASPNITSGIEATFKRPIRNSDKFIDVVATVANISETGISLLATVLNSKGKVSASGISTCVFLTNRVRI